MRNKAVGFFGLLVGLWTWQRPAWSQSPSPLYQRFLQHESNLKAIRSSALGPSSDTSSLITHSPSLLPASIDSSLAWGEVFVFPNPAKAGKAPVLHIESGIADRVEIKIYDIAGDLVHQTTLTGSPQVIDSGQGPRYAYEYAWQGSIASGVYLYLIEAVQGSNRIKKTGRFSVIR